MKNKTLRTGFFGVVLLMLAVGVFAFSFRTQAASPSAVSSLAPIPHVSILNHKGKPVFGKTSITVNQGELLNFINRTSASQSVIANGNTLVTVPAKSTVHYVFNTAGTYKLSLASNSSAMLTVTVQ